MDLISSLNHSIKTAMKSDFYNKRIQQVKDMNSFRALPVTNKQDLLKLLPSEMITVNHEDLFEYHETSGSADIPLSTWFTENDFQAYVDQISECSIEFNEADIVLIRFPYALSVPAHTFTRTVQSHKGCVIHAGRSDNNCPPIRVIDLLTKAKATIMCCNVQEAFIIGELCKRKEINFKNNFSLRALCVAGELFTPSRKRRLEDLWGVKVYNFYGTTETGNIASTNEVGELIIPSNHFYCEVLNPDTLEVLPFGEKGILHITNLSKECFPLIRFNTGDIVKILRDKNKESLIHYGRYSDRIIIKDKQITFREFQEEFLSLPENIIGNIWKVEVKDEKAIIVAESREVDHKTHKSITLNLPVPYEIQFVPEGTIIDMDSLNNWKCKSKPQYIYHS